ncbi:hypothetical protein NOR_06507 [Metarhizium rileyi]|uniref:Uncharacterized protein n=1 Tax=Metarhizium rileyi (strain RCEF 4871) TaxID=1649241 RepID=A0A167AFE2_METRR|nr:hypothetical protein NOR_06507 [Metarhizium rileyi RCEF 4871]
MHETVRELATNMCCKYGIPGDYSAFRTEDPATRFYDLFSNSTSFALETLSGTLHHAPCLLVKLVVIMLITRAEEASTNMSGVVVELIGIRFAYRRRIRQGWKYANRPANRSANRDTSPQEVLYSVRVTEYYSDGPKASSYRSEGHKLGTENTTCCRPLLVPFHVFYVDCQGRLVFKALLLPFSCLFRACGLSRLGCLARLDQA